MKNYLILFSLLIFTLACSKEKGAIEQPVSNDGVIDSLPPNAVDTFNYPVIFRIPCSFEIEVREGNPENAISDVISEKDTCFYLTYYAKDSIYMDGCKVKCFENRLGRRFKLIDNKGEYNSAEISFSKENINFLVNTSCSCSRPVHLKMTVKALLDKSIKLPNL